MKPVEEISPVNAGVFEREIRPAYRPVVMRGLTRDWPVLVEGQKSASEALAHVESFDTGRLAEIMIAPQSEKGRFFYSADMRGFNFRREQLSLSGLAQHLRQIADHPDPIGIYAGAAAIDDHLPGFAGANPLPLTKEMQATPRIWLGNKTQVATHFDMSDNIAVVALGKRRFTLFPPEATEDLYVGPLNVTLAGQPVSMVDPLNPDYDTFPRFKAAKETAVFADLEPGDAIYIPTLWWHHVAAQAPINILVNYWHNDVARAGGFLVLVHAMLSIRDLPLAQRKAWRAWFDHFVFGKDAGGSASHLPSHAQGVNGPAAPARDEQIRQFIIQVLSSN